MNNRGFSLIELLIVIALIGILGALVTFGFSQYSRKSGMEKQTRLLYGNFMEYRVKSLYEKRNYTFVISANDYRVYPTTDTTGSPVVTVDLKYPVDFDVANIVFDTQGITNNQGAVCISSANDAAVDSVVISTTRVQIGKKGASCASAQIVAK